jgi:uncharacterized protein
VDFAWDPKKAGRNLIKHGISFEEAKTAFDDDLFLVFADPDHSAGERRFIILGESAQGRLQVVAYAERGDAIWIVNARKATRRERRAYEEGV